MNTIQNEPMLVQLYDYSKVKEYYKDTSGLIFFSEKLVRADTIENYTVLNIQSEKIPDKILLNGKEMKLVETKPTPKKA